MRAAQICALKRDGKVIGFEAEPYVPDEIGYVAHKGGLMEYSAISRFIIVANDKTGSKPARCTGNIPMADTAYIHLKLQSAIAVLDEQNRKKRLAAMNDAGMSQDFRDTYIFETEKAPPITIYEPESKILLSHKDKDGHSLVYNISIICDPTRNMPFIFTLTNFYSSINKKADGKMNYYGTQYDKSIIKFFANMEEAVGVLEQLYEFSRDFRNNTFTAQLALMRKLNNEERRAAKDKATVGGSEDNGDSVEVADTEVSAPYSDENSTPSPTDTVNADEKSGESKATASRDSAYASSAAKPSYIPPSTYDPNAPF